MEEDFIGWKGEGPEVYPKKEDVPKSKLDSELTDVKELKHDPNSGMIVCPECGLLVNQSCGNCFHNRFKDEDPFDV